MSYTSSSGMGAAQSTSVSQGSSYGGFTLANTTGHHTTVSLLGGTAGSGQLVNSTFIAAPTGTFVSDAVTLSGTGSDLHVVQLSYDPTAVTVAGLNANNLILLWLNSATQTWTNSVNGDSDGGAAQQGFLGAYNPATEFVLGDYGVDTTNDTVWAVVDHNSEYVAGAIPAPEPSAWVMMLGSVGLLTGFKRFGRRSKP